MKKIDEYNADLVKNIQTNLQLQKIQWSEDTKDYKKSSLPQEILDIRYGGNNKTDKDIFNPYNQMDMNFAFKKPEKPSPEQFIQPPVISSTSSSLLAIVANSYKSGEKIKLTDSTLKHIRNAIQSPGTQAEQDAIFILNKAAERSEKIPFDLQIYVSQGVTKPNYGSNSISASKPGYNPQVIKIIADGFANNQVGVKKFTDSTINQLKAVLTDTKADSKLKQDVIFIITEALRHVGKEEFPELNVPDDLAKLAGVNQLKEPIIDVPVDPYKNLAPIAKMFSDGKNIKLTGKTVTLLKSALENPDASKKVKQDAAGIVFAAYGNEGQELVTEELLELAQNS